MTIEEFLELLSKTPRDWKLVKLSGSMRLRTPDFCCPLSACHPARLSAVHGMTAGVSIGLAPRQCAAIMEAADGPNGDPALRAQLLVACGLAPEGEKRDG